MRVSFELFARKARGLAPASFTVCKSLATGLASAELADAPDSLLRSEHARGLDDLRARDPLEPTAPLEYGRASLLDVKRALARRSLASCRLCALDCRVDRTAGPAGACGLGPGLARYRDFVHEGEEPEVSPTHAVLLAGCNYRCSYCSDWPHVDEPGRHALTTSETLARSIEARRAAGVASLSWIGGEPLVNLPGILDALALARVSVPVVWNSNLHATADVMDLLEGVVDLHVADWKHGNDACARAVARAPDYGAVVGAAIARASRDAFTIVRHLVLPGHVECCSLPALEAIARTLPGARVNLMAQYRPGAQVAGTPLDRRPTEDELARARQHARGLGLDLAPRGRLVGPEPTAAPVPAPGPAPEGAISFESAIFVDDDGSVTFENLSPDLADVARELGRPTDPGS